MKEKFMIHVVLTGILLSACSSAPQTEIVTEETLLAEALQATLTAAAPTATPIPTDTPMPTETPDPFGKFLTPLEMLETFYPESEGWSWKDLAGRWGEKNFPENNYDCTINYSIQVPNLFLSCKIRMKDWANDDFAISVFTDVLSKVVDANTQQKMSEFFLSDFDEEEKFESTIDGFSVSITKEKNKMDRRWISVSVWEKLY